MLARIRKKESLARDKDKINSSTRNRFSKYVLPGDFLYKFRAPPSWKWFGSRNKRAEGLSPSPLFVETSLLRERGQWIYGGKNSPTRHVSPSYNFGETILALEGLEEGERRGHGPGRSSYALLPTTTTRTTPRPFGQWVTRCVCLPPPSPLFFLNYGSAGPPFSPLSFFQPSLDRVVLLPRSNESRSIHRRDFFIASNPQIKTSGFNRSTKPVDISCIHIPTCQTQRNICIVKKT